MSVLLELILRQLGFVPAAAEVFDEEDGVGHLLGVKAGECLAVVQVTGLGDDDVEIAVDAELVTVVGEVQVPEGRLDCGVLLLNLYAENAQRGKIVFDRLKCGQNRLAIFCDGGGVCSIVLPGGGDQGSVENGLAGAGTDGPN